MPASRFWSNKAAPMGFFDAPSLFLNLLIPRRPTRNGSGPSLLTTSWRSSSVINAHVWGPVKCQAELSWTRRNLIVSLGGSSLFTFRNLPIRPRWTWRIFPFSQWQKRCFPHASDLIIWMPFNKAALSANRPWGDVASMLLLTKSFRKSAANRWIVCPSGTIRTVASNNESCYRNLELQTLLQCFQSVLSLHYLYLCSKLTAPKTRA